MYIPTQFENVEAEMAMELWLSGKQARENIGPNIRRKSATFFLIVEA